MNTGVQTPQTAAGASRPAAEPTVTGSTVWFTGLPSAGKSTIAHAVADRLAASGARVQVLDGDAVRPHLSGDLGYGKDARDINVARIGWVARLLATHGVTVLVPVIAPYAAARDAVRADHAAAGVPFREVYVSTSLQVAEQRDVKGLYAKARRGELSGLTGVDDPYEAPPAAELVIDTGAVDLDTAVRTTVDFLAGLEPLGPERSGLSGLSELSESAVSDGPSESVSSNAGPSTLAPSTLRPSTLRPPNLEPAHPSQFPAAGAAR